MHKKALRPHIYFDRGTGDVISGGNTITPGGSGTQSSSDSPNGPGRKLKHDSDSVGAGPEASDGTDTGTGTYEDAKSGSSGSFDLESALGSQAAAFTTNTLPVGTSFSGLLTHTLFQMPPLHMHACPCKQLGWKPRGKPLPISPTPLTHPVSFPRSGRRASVFLLLSPIETVYTTACQQEGERGSESGGLL